MPSDFKSSLWDDTEPLYAPGRTKVRDKYYWVPPKKYRQAGYAVKTVPLGNVSEVDELDVAYKCRALTREMLDWYNGEEESRIQHGSWGYVIQRYIHDDISSIHDVRPATREQYIKILNRVAEAIGDILVKDTDYAELVRWKRQMEDNGRSIHYIKQWFTHFGLALSHGVKLRIEGCADVKAIRSEMRIQTPPRRTQYATREQIYQVVEEADRRGLTYLSLAILFRFEFLLRGVDVQGQWVPNEGREGGILHNGRRWEDGLTWEMFDRDLTCFTKVISKTKKSMPEPYKFDLTQVSEIRDRLCQIPREKRVGPVIVMPNGQPPKTNVLSTAFRRIKSDLELPKDLQIRDARSGGITEAKGMVDTYELRDAAQHSQVTTTNIYARGRSDGANKVVSIRQEKSKRQG